MTENTILLAKLRDLIGRRVVYQGRPYWIIEIIETGLTAVLQEISAETSIQANQFGEAHRRTGENIIIPVVIPGTMTLHPDFLSLELS